jgi:fermentation-respiration switch protein FrsA (DUF1100 family)
MLSRGPLPYILRSMSRSSRKWVPRVLRLLAAIVLLYTTATALLWWRQDDFLFRPSREYTILPDSAGLTHENVDIEVEPGTTIRGWFIPASGKPVGTVLYFHGNARNLSYYLHRVAPFAAAGFNSLSIDYEGYGESGGVPSEASLYRDADAAWNWLTETKGVESNRIVVWGYSLGGAAAIWCASKHDAGAVVLESTFTTIPDVGAHVFPWLPVKLVSRSEFPSLARVPMIREPILIAHGTQDNLTPFAMGRQLYEAAMEPKRFVELPGGHSDALVQNPGAWNEVRSFLAAAGFIAQATDD